MECEVTSKTYRQIKVVPAGTKLIGEMQLSQKTLGFYMTAFTAAMLARSESATLITDSESVRVTKNSGEIWVAGDSIYWDEANSNFTNVNNDDWGAELVLVGKAAQAAANLAVLGFMDFKDFYPHTGETYTILAKDPLLPLYGTVAVTTGKVSLAEFSLEATGVGGDSSIKTLRAQLVSDVKMGNAAGAFHAAIYLLASGGVTGAMSVIASTLNLPSSAIVGGWFYGNDNAIEIPAGGTWGAGAGQGVVFQRFTLAGAGKAIMDTRGYIFSIDGVVPADSKMVDNSNAPGAAAGSLRILINGTAKYIAYSDAQS